MSTELRFPAEGPHIGSASAGHPADAGLAYATAGVVLGLGAPLGFLALRRALSLFGATRRWMQHTRASDIAAVAYMGLTTPAVFGAFGRVLGDREQRLRAASKEIAQLREEFSAVVAHDLRNPVQAILLELQLLADAKNGANVEVPLAALERLRRNADRLTHMINDLLDATRLEASRLLLVPEAVSIPQAVAALVDRIRVTLGQHPIEVDVEGEPARIWADPRRFDQILTNLLQNAAKFSDENTAIAIGIRGVGAGVEISVTDRGFGITAAELPRLFDRFYQAKRARAMKTGLGLGLYITKGLVDAHGGRIDVQSEPGRGSTFSVWFPSRDRL